MNEADALCRIGLTGTAIQKSTRGTVDPAQLDKSWTLWAHINVESLDL